MKVSSGTAPEGRREFRSARPRTRREVGRLGREPGLSHFWSSVGHLDHASSPTSKSPAARSTPHASNTLYATPDSHRTTNTCGDGRPRGTNPRAIIKFELLADLPNQPANEIVSFDACDQLDTREVLAPLWQGCACRRGDCNPAYTRLVDRHPDRHVTITQQGMVYTYYNTIMAKEKVTLTLNTEQLEELRSLVDARSLSSTVDHAVSAYLSRLRHFRAVDQWLAELEAQHGPVAPETLEWAAQIVDEWESSDRPATAS